MSDVLDVSALLHVLPGLLPSGEGNVLRSPQDALAAMVHTIMTRLDFRLVGLSDEDRLDTSATSNQLPPNWSMHGPDSYAFRYKHDQSSLDYLIKVVKLGPRAMIHGIAMQGSKTNTLQLPYADYFSPSFWPFNPASADATSAREPLVNGYISSSRLNDLVIAFKTQILQGLVPGLSKPGYTEDSTTSSSSSSVPRAGGSESRPTPGTQPPPRSPFHGDEDDPSQPASFIPPFRNPLTIGDRDLDPLGGSPLAMPPRFGGGGFAPPPLFPGGDTGGGMIVGPNHPMFRDRFAHPSAQNLPPGAVPPGARFDPIHPSDPSFPGGMQGPRFNPDVGGPNPQPRAPGHPSGDPDWDDLAPPTFNNHPPNFGAGRRHPPGPPGGSDHWYS